MSQAGERDDEDQQGGGTESGLRPVQTPLIREAGDAGKQEDEYDVVETDDSGTPIGGDKGEGRLSEADAGAQPVIRGGESEITEEQRRQRKHDREPSSARNARRRENRERRDLELERYERENGELRQRLENLEGSVRTQVEPRLIELGEGRIRDQAAAIDKAIADSATAAKSARGRMTAAMQSADNEALMSAMEDRDNAVIRGVRLEAEKRQIDDAIAKSAERRQTGGDQTRQADGAGDQRRQAPAPMPTRVQYYAQQFARDFDWFKGRDIRDIDSQTVLAIDRAVAEDGFDPSTQDYWHEVEDRMREKLPWHFQDESTQGADNRQRRQQDGGGGQREAAPRNQQQPLRRGPPSGAPSDRGPVTGNRKTVTISPARKEAMIQAGAIGNDGRVLDAPRYKRLLTKYAEFDRDNPTAAR